MPTDDAGTCVMGATSFAEISNSVAQPTGTLAASNAKAVADAYGKLSSGAPAGERIAANNFTEACPAGGSLAASTNGNQSTPDAYFTYDNCCETQGCCLNGCGQMFYAPPAATSGYVYCGAYDIDYTCNGTFSLNYLSCLGMGGELIYLVDVAAETFAVSGSYANGNGTLKIAATNGVWNCSYANGSGSCTGAAGSFDF